MIEESHLGKASLWAVALILSSVFLIPALQSWSMVGLVIGLVLAGAVVWLPFMIVLAFRGYRRLEIWRGVEVVDVKVYRLGRPRSVRVPWGAVAQVDCERLEGNSDAPDGLSVTLRGVDGSERRLLGGWYSEDLVSTLGRYLGDKLAVPK